MNQEKRSLPIIPIAIVIAVLIAAGIIGYFLVLKKEIQPAQGCGNGACETDETFESCILDCNLPNSIEPYISLTSLSATDLPLPPKDTQWVIPRDTHWSTFLDNYTISVEGGYLPPAFNKFKLLSGKQTAIRLAEYDPPSGGEIALDDMARIDQYVLVYSPKDMEKIFKLTTKSVLALPGTDAAPEDLPDPGIGDKSKAFKFPSSDGRSAIYVIVFTKKAYFEMIMLRGTIYEYKVLEDIARKAAEKIR